VEGGVGWEGGSLHEVVDAFFAHFEGGGMEVSEGSGCWDWRGKGSGSEDGLLACGCGKQCAADCRCQCDCRAGNDGSDGSKYKYVLRCCGIRMRFVRCDYKLSIRDCSLCMWMFECNTSRWCEGQFV